MEWISDEKTVSLMNVGGPMFTTGRGFEDRLTGWKRKNETL
jgi:hypothetical protein